MFRTAALAVVRSRRRRTRNRPRRRGPARIVPKDAFFLVQATSLIPSGPTEAGAWYAMYQDDGMRGSAPGRERLRGDEVEGEGRGVLDATVGLSATMHGSFAVFGVVGPGQKIPALGVLLDPGEPRGAFEDLLAKTLDEFGKKAELAQSTDEYAGV